MREALPEVATMRRFVGIELITVRIPDKLRFSAWSFAGGSRAGPAELCDCQRPPQRSGQDDLAEPDHSCHRHLGAQLYQHH